MLARHTPRHYLAQLKRVSLGRADTQSFTTEPRHMVEIREEMPEDHAAVHALNRTAFDGDAEARIVDKLRASCSEYLSLVAVDGHEVVGHILFTPVNVERHGVAGMGLAPMAVSPSRQREGIGSLLVQLGLRRLRDSSCPFVVVLGHPEYYPRFGFEPASKHGLVSQWEGVPDEAFMVLVFDRDSLPGAGGVARYRDEFDEAM